MWLFCVDTDLIISVLKRDTRALDLLAEIEAQGTVHISTINVFELYYAGSGLSAGREKVLSDLLDNIGVLPLDKESALLAGKIGRELRWKGKTLSSMDLMIGAIAMANNMTLVTRNVEHFSRIEGLRIGTW